MTGPTPRKRKRATISCQVCRRRKLRCDREHPCSNCIKSKDVSCVYEDGQRQDKGPKAAHVESWDSKSLKEIHFPTPEDTASQGSPPRNLDQDASQSGDRADNGSYHELSDGGSMRKRIRDLEAQIARYEAWGPPKTFTPTSANHAIDETLTTTTSRLIGTFHFKDEDNSNSSSRFPVRNVIRKTRLFGQSHWANFAVQLREILELIEPLIKDESSKVGAGLLKCKYLGRMIKFNRLPAWPCIPTTDLPGKSIADELLNNYLRTTETIYPILHIPSFRRDYEKLWLPDQQSDISFVIQVKLVLAIGAMTYDAAGSLRPSAIQWLYEGQTHLSNPRTLSKLTIQDLQSRLLLVLAQEFASKSADTTWITIGEILRVAFFMGLHRDPTRLPKISHLAAEMRRRLWNTILEYALQSSLNSGGPPLISLSDFDTRPPGNFDDEQLANDDAEAKPLHESTRMTVAIALRSTVPIRLKIVKSLNDLESVRNFDVTLSLDKELRVALKQLRATLNRVNGYPPRSEFETRAINVILHRYLTSLHTPYFDLATKQAKFAYSRQTLTDSAIQIWSAAFRRSDYPTRQNCLPHDQVEMEPDGFLRLVLAGRSSFRMAAVQATFQIAAELRAQLRDEEGFGPDALRPDLLQVLDEAKIWSLQCIEAGETDMKGHLMSSLISAQIEGYKNGLSKAQLPVLLMKAAEEAQDRCIPILENRAGGGQVPDERLQASTVDLNKQVELLEDWGFMSVDNPFGYVDAGPIGWNLDTTGFAI